MKFLYLVAILSITLGCGATNSPVPFETGAEVSPPRGCVEMRKEDPNADC